MSTRASREAVDAICKEFADKGLLIEAGFQSYRLMVLDQDAPTIQQQECRLAFFAGAQHLWGSVMGILDRGPDNEATENDLRRMSLINDELMRFVETLKNRVQ